MNILPVILLILLPLGLHASCTIVQSSSVLENALQACHQLQQVLGTSLVQNSSGQTYESGVTASWNLFNTEFAPSCIVFPREGSHVQAAMKAIFDADVDYAVQAGGHSAMKGWNNVQDGVLISFLFMNDTSYDPSSDTITLLPGIRWGQAVAILEPQGVGPVGGRINDVGTGLLLGGGISFLSPAHGFAADTYVELDVVLVNGDMVTATVDNEYADLFRALKGGTNRFGIVTRYKVQAIHTGDRNDKFWFGGQILYPNSSAEAVLRAVARYVHDTRDPNAALLTLFASTIENSSVVPVIAANLFYNGTENSFNTAFSAFLAIPSTTSSLGPLSYLDISNLLAESANASGHGQLFGAKVLDGIPSSEDTYLQTFRLFTNFSETFATQLDSAVLAFTPILDHQIMIGRERGGNAIDPPLRGGYNAIQFQVTLPSGVAEISEEMEAGRQLFLIQAPSSPGYPLYINECDAKQDVFETYGGFEFLKSTYKKYDPMRFNVRHMQGPEGL